MVTVKDDISEGLIRAEFAGFAQRRRDRGLPRILIADASKAVRELMATLVNEDFEVVGEAETGQRALEECLEAKPDAIILDIQIPGMNGLQVARELKQHLPDTYIVFVTQQRWSDCVAEAFRAGGDGYVHKTRLMRDLGHVLRRRLTTRREAPCHS